MPKRQLSGMLVLAMISVLLAGCVNPYSRYYHDLTGGADLSKTPGIVPTDEAPVISPGRDMDADYQTMYGEGYLLIGYSLFNGKEFPEYLAKQQAQAVKAQRVVVYAKYTGTEQQAVPVSVPTTAVAKTAYAGSGGYGVAATTVVGSTTAMVPVSVRRFDQVATYWVRAIRNPILGIDFRDLTPAQKASIQTNKGVSVFAIQKGTPAYNADLLTGDILKSFGGQEVTEVGAFKDLLRRFAGQEVRVDFLRDGKPMSKQVILNSVPQLANPQ